MFFPLIGTDFDFFDLWRHSRPFKKSESHEASSTTQYETSEEEEADDFENLYKGQISKSGIAILPSKRTRKIPEAKKPSLAEEALSELKSEQPVLKEENLDTEESPLELKEEVEKSE